MHELEGSVGEDDATVTPYFEDVFEGLCQFLDIAQSQNSKLDRRYIASSASIPLVRAKSSLLARRPTKLPHLAEEPTEQVGAWGNMERLARHIGLHKQVGQQIVIDGGFHAITLSKLHGADEVQLAQLARFEAEIQVLAQQLVLDSEHITNHQQRALDRLYANALSGLYASHCDDVVSQVSQDAIEFHTDIAIPESYRKALDPLKECSRYANPSYKTDAQAWALLGLTGLALYVPNYPHDPALRPMVERDLFNGERSNLLGSLQMLREFQVGFTGQDTSFRIRLIEDAIRHMGEEPPVPAIVRPNVSELDALQGVSFFG